MLIRSLQGKDPMMVDGCMAVVVRLLRGNAMLLSTTMLNGDECYC